MRFIICLRYNRASKQCKQLEQSLRVDAMASCLHQHETFWNQIWNTKNKLLYLFTTVDSCCVEESIPLMYKKTF